MKAITFHPDADAEVISAAGYYEEQQNDLGKRFLSSVEEGLARIRFNPLLFPSICGDVRRCLMRTFPFGILFRLTENNLTVVAVIHLKRKPGYWKNRI